MNFLNIFENHVAGILGAAQAPFSFKKLAKQTAREMEEQTLVVNGVNTAPALYTVLIANDDDPLMAPYYPELTRELVGYANELFDDEVHELEKPFSGTDDLAILAEHVPTTYFILGTGTLPGHEGAGMHHPNVDFDESVFWKGTALLAQSALAYLAHRAA